MSIQKYSVNQHPIQTILTWIRSKEIAIPEIQRPFVWNGAKVRDLMDSLYQGYPVGYLIAWRNPTVKLKDGTSSQGKRILIDGQQRVTALMAAIMGESIINKYYQKTKITIAFHPQKRRFEVSNPAISRDKAWVSNISEIFADEFSFLNFVRVYCDRNEGTDQDSIYKSLELLRGIVNNHLGLIELNPDLDIEIVTEIFIRINSKGATLNQADFVMSKIAVNETYGGNRIRKCIDYFCHLAVDPHFYQQIPDLDREFAATEHFQKMSWLKNKNDDLYNPSYIDMLRVAFVSEFKRGRLQELVALLSGRNFETRTYEDAIAEDSFKKFDNGIINFINENNFQRFIMILRSAGFIEPSMIRSQNAINFAYVIYLVLKSKNTASAQIESLVRKWFVMSILTGRYSGSSESTIDMDIKKIDELGMKRYQTDIEAAELSEAFWDVGLPQQMDTSVANSQYLKVFLAAQVYGNDKGFLSKDITVRDLLTNRGDVHHIFPKNYLKHHNFAQAQYNQIANYVIMQSEINIAIQDRAPADYFTKLQEQCKTQIAIYGGIVTQNQLEENLAANCLPLGMESKTINDYAAFLEERRKLMSYKIRDYYSQL